jgi:hypothetical protein
MPVTIFVFLPQINLQFFVQLNLHYHSSNVASGRETIPLEVSRRTWKPNNHRVPLRLRPGRFDDCHIHSNFSPQRVGEQSDSNAKLRTLNKEPMDAAPRSVECWIARMILFLEVKSNVQENRLMVSKSLKLYIYIYDYICVYMSTPDHHRSVNEQRCKGNNECCLNWKYPCNLLFSKIDRAIYLMFFRLLKWPVKNGKMDPQ